MSNELVLKACELQLVIERPLVMGIVNATPDSFSDAGRYPDLDTRFRLALKLVAQGADLIDIGGESAVTNRPAIGVVEEIERVCPLIERLEAAIDVPISVDTYKPAVARAAISAGAVIVNDVSGLKDPELACVCAETGAALVVMHTRARPKFKLVEPAYPDVVDDVLTFIDEKIEQALEFGVDRDQIIVDPGPDFAKSPAQSIKVLHSLDSLADFDRPILLAASRKDFIGALTLRPPQERLAGTLAAIAYGIGKGATILRVHDVAETADLLKVWSALNGEQVIDDHLVIDDSLRWQDAEVLSS